MYDRAKGLNRQAVSRSHTAAKHHGGWVQLICRQKNSSARCETIAATSTATAGTWPLLTRATECGTPAQPEPQSWQGRRSLFASYLYSKPLTRQSALGVPSCPSW